MRNWNCDKSLWQALAKRIYKLLKTWSVAKFRRWPERSFSMQVQVISMQAMQVMVNLVMDLLDRIASEAAPILNFLNWKARRPWRLMRFTLAQDSHCETARTEKHMPSTPGPESRTLHHIEVHSIHELDCRDSSACCNGVGRPPCSVRAGATCTYRTKI